MVGFRLSFRKNGKVGILIQVFVLVISVSWILGCQQYATRDLSISDTKHFPSQFGGKIKNVIFFGSSTFHVDRKPILPATI